MKTYRVGICSLAVVIGSLSFSGCFLCGLGIGAAIDGGKVDYRSLTVLEASALPRGSEVKVDAADGKFNTGLYFGLARHSSQGCDQIADSSAYSQGNAGLHLGEQVSISFWTGHDYLKAEGLLIDLNPKSLSISSLPEWKVTTFVLKDVTLLVREDGGTIGQSALWSMVQKGPSLGATTLSAIVVSLGNDTLFVPLAKLRIPSKRSAAKWWGVGVGLTVDLVIVIALATQPPVGSWRID